MPNPREIHRHMRSISNIQQITKAMKMVAAARLRRAQEKAASSRPFAEKIESMLITAMSDSTLQGKLDLRESPLMASRSIHKTGFIVIAADKGLAGPYNSNVLKHALAEIAECENYSIVTVGRKAKEFFQHRGFDVAKDFFGLSDKPNFDYANQIAETAAEMFTSGEVDEVKLISTRFKSALSFTPETIQLLPLQVPGNKAVTISGGFEPQEGEEEEIGDVLYEPDPSTLLKQLLPDYVKTLIYAALMQSAASELGARMTAMSSATDNASDLLRSLELSYNKARQAGITREINEIVGGAEALNQQN
jgi:F-type H+-transporting ATPase subunit gamma